ncbi:MAG TPA: hypothetical protein VF006_12975 [Longimicrobium sp.]
MRRIIGAVLLAAATAGCASGGDPAGRDLSRAPRTWTPEEREPEAPLPEPESPVPRSAGGYPDPESPVPRSAGGYPDPAARAPLYRIPEDRWAPVGREAAEVRRLAGRGAAFLGGVEAHGGTLPVRGAVWVQDAFPVAAGADTVMFATPWVPVSRMGGELRCDPVGPGERVQARLVGRFRAAGPDLLVAGWLETKGTPACVGGGAARDRVRAFVDDLDLFARDAARRGVPVSLPRG